MSLQEYIKGLQNILKKFTPNRFMDAVMIPPANRFLADLKNRIQKEGKNSEGQKIGVYSTNPMYVVKDKFVKKSAFKPQGQRGFIGEKIVQSSKLGKYKPGIGYKPKSPKVQQRIIKSKPDTMYLQNGYKELREIQGMPVDKVDLTYSTSMMQNYTLGVKKESREIVLGFSSDEEYKKAMGNEEHFKAKIFTGTKEEIEQYKKEVSDRYKAFVSQYLTGIYGSGNISETE